MRVGAVSQISLHPVSRQSAETPYQSMNYIHRSGKSLLAAGLAALALLHGGCITQGIGDMYDPRAHIQVTTPSKATKPSASGVAVSATGVAPYGGLKFKNGTGYIGEFTAALQVSVAASGLFGAQAAAPARYKLEADILECNVPSSGTTMTADVEVSYALSDTQSGKKVWSKAIKTADTRTTSDSITGAYREFIAVNGAFRKNIESALAAMSELNLP